MWMGIVGDQLVGPIFLDRSLNGERYLQLLQNTLPPLLENLDVAPEEMWWQQDGAPPHNVALVTEFLNETYEDRWIGIRSPHRRWPARLPDHTIMDFYLWGRVKTLVYRQVID